MAVSLMNARTQEPLATSVELATTRRTRRRGLLGRNSLDRSAALVLEPCAAVHTAFMRFSIDLVFVDREGCAVKLVEDLPPWRIALSTGAHAVIEMAAGSLRRLDLSIGDRLYMQPESDKAATDTAGPDGKNV
jgi:uncharacterized membrane protein (UPF0127 family)